MDDDNNLSGMGFEPVDTSHKITQLGCTLCGAIIGEHGTVKGAKINGHKLLAALCENHAGMPITKFMTEN